MLGLVGCGYWGTHLMREFNRITILHMICDKDISLLQRHKALYPNLQTTTNYEDMLNDSNIDMICIALPAELHYQYTRLALQHNKHVFVEKPFVLNIDHATKLIQFAKDKHKILFVGHLLHYHPCIKVIKKLINNGEIGDIVNIVSNRFNLGKIRKNENVLWSFAPHDISVILSLLGKPNYVSCTGSSYINSDIYDITNTILMFPNSYVNINVNWLNPYKEQKLTIIGTKGMIIFDDTNHVRKLVMYKDYLNINKDIIKTDPIYPKYDNITPLEVECKEFVKCCLENKQPYTNGEEGLRVLEVLTKCEESLHTNKPINFSTINIQEGEKSVPSSGGSLSTTIHESSIIDKGAVIGNGSTIWHFCHITNSAIIGKNCNIGQNCYIAGKIGNRCKVQNNVSIYKGVEAGDGVFFGPSCVLTNDKTPKALYPKNGVYMTTIIENEVSIGANATIICGVRLGKGCMIGAGTVVTKDVEPYTTVIGNPAYILEKI